MAGIRHGNTIGNFIRATFPALYKGKPWKSHQQARPYGTDSFAFRQERIGEDRGVSDKYVSASKEAWRNGLFGIHSCNFWGGSRLNKNKFLRNQELHCVSSITINTSDQNHFWGRMFQQSLEGAFTNCRCLDHTPARPTELEPPGLSPRDTSWSKGSEADSGCATA